MTEDRPTTRATPAGSRSASSGRASGVDLVTATLRVWRRHLADLGGPNTLLWYHELGTGSLDLTHAHPGGLAMLLAGRETRLSDLIREQDALIEARRRARAIRRKVVELREERGLVVGYLALGMATWDAPGTARTPAAPVLLRACTLAPVDVSERDFTVDLGDDVEFNPALAHYLRSEEDLDVDAGGLAMLALADGGFNPTPVYDALTRLCEDVPQFVVTPGFVVSTFSYAKLPMVADLSVSASDIASHRIVSALAGDEQSIDALRSRIHSERPAREAGAADQPLPRAGEGTGPFDLDADASQQAAVDAVLAGQDIVVDAPPGTGRSETVANLVAALAGEGRSCLLVTEKRVGIDRVRSRLHALGLGDLVLDVLDGVGANRALIEGLTAHLTARDPVHAADATSTEEARAAALATLRDHVSALHETREPWGVSAYRAQEEIAGLAAREHPPRTHVRLDSDALGSIDRDRLEGLAQDLTDVAERGGWDPGVPDDPWFGARIETAEDADRAAEICARLSGDGVRGVQQTFDEVFAELRVPPARTPADYGEFLSAVEGVRDTFEVFRPEVYDQPLDSLIAATGTAAERSAADISVAEGWRLRRQVRELLRPGTPPKDLHAALVAAQRQRNDWASMAGAGGRPQLPVDVERAHAAYESLHADLTWLGGRLEGTAAGGDLLRTPVDELAVRLETLTAHVERLTVLPSVIPGLDRLREAGLGPLVEDLSHRGVEPDDVRDELVFCWWTSLADHFVGSDRRLSGPHGDELREAARDFADADRAVSGDAAMRIRAAVADRRGQALRSHREQVGAIKDAARVPGTSLRELVMTASDVLFALRPCWTMSPLAVAGNVPPGEWFDVVVVDQASQVATPEAVSAIARGRQVVVVGDDHQVGPQPFATVVPDDPVPDPPTTPSVMSDLGPLLARRELRWDHRYLDERLVSFSNRQFYGDRITTFPSTRPLEVVRLEVVDGRGVLDTEDGVVETTEAEVGRVVELVREHAASRPDESLAVITLTPAQTAAVEGALRDAVLDDPRLASYMAARGSEPFVVKPVGNAQGDVRDAAIVTVGYGRTVHGRVLHRFGPISADGGESRVNVAMTRARSRLTVVASFTGEDLDPSRLKGPGPRALRAALLHAASGGRREPGPVTTTSPLVPSIGLLEQDLAARLRRAGLTVHERVGVGDHPVAIAVSDPRDTAAFVLAIESDGPEYAGVASVRERDRLRVEALRWRGWHHMRVWTTDLYRDPGREEARVLATVHEITSGRFTRPPERAQSGPAGESAPAGKPGPESDAEGSRGPNGDEKPRASGPTRVRPRHRESLEQTRDDTDEGWGEWGDREARDRWLEEERPPHWE